MPASDSEVFDIDHPLLQKHSGLSTKEALNNLYYEILQFKINTCDKKKNRRYHRQIIWCSFHHSSYYSSLSWIPICILTMIFVALVIFTSTKYLALFILSLTILNVIVLCWDNYLRLNEFEHRLNYVLKMIRRTKKRNNWRRGQFPNLFTPNSPAVSLQWTIRDGRVLNLPTVLLAKGDVIILKPGQLAPASIETLYPAPSPEDKYNVLVTDQIFAYEPSIDATGIIRDNTNAHRSIEQTQMNDRLYVVLKAPYVTQLDALSESRFERPVSLYDKARYLLLSKCLHHIMLPIILVFCEILAFIRWCIFPIVRYENFFKNQGWTFFFIIEPTSLVISMVSLVFPIFWFISNAFGNALLLSRYSSTDKQMYDQMKENLQKTESSYFDDVEASFRSHSESNLERRPRRRNHLFPLFCNFAQINRTGMIRYTNFLHTMASVTVLCCVDKKGVLSFPNPIAEKVFFLKNHADCKSLSNNGEIKWDGKRTVASTNEDNISGSLHKLADEYRNDKSSKRIAPSIEILDITPRDEKGSAWKIEFDDSRWRFHLNSLKPLGLAILVNTCNMKTHETYNSFYAFITGHAVQHKHLVPVANRRCLCELARQIGFHENHVEEKYNLELQLFTYKNLAEMHAGNKYVKAIFKTRKPKFPFPHAMSVIVSGDASRNVYSRTCSIVDDNTRRRQSISHNEEKQMFSQGTADIILDYCVDYWDGCDVHPLTPTIRKKILDFYQRCSLTAYCTTFSYRPVHKNLRGISRCNSNSAVYLEFLKSIEPQQREYRQKRRPRKGGELKKCEKNLSFFSNFGCHKSYYKNDRETSPLQELTECDEDIDDNFGDNIEDYDEDIDCSLVHCDSDLENEDYSDDSEEEDEYIDNELYDENKSVVTEEMDSLTEAKNRSSQTSNYVKTLGKQIFLGMVSMQYQPLVDMVQMIEDLEKACIRFVHFSKENELRSRVFSEKMGLESGWNCHISLLPDADSKSLLEGYGSEGISLAAEHEVYSVLDTGASSADDEENVPFSFDLSNRAKLPCGIKNIRPHLEQVDNVPLLVSLFTDCTSDTTEQMLTIMQDYGQIICVLGSSANIKNVLLFARADSSISVEPLYAQVCQQIPSSLMNESSHKKCPSPTELSRMLSSLPCSLILQRNYNYHRILPIYSLIAESRNLMRSVWNCVQFWLCCIALTISVQLLALLLMLPAIFTLEQALWMSVVVIPCLSISLTTADHDADIMTKAKGKDWLCSVNWETIKYALTCYGSKLLCGVIAIIISYFVELMHACDCLNRSDMDDSSSVNSTAIRGPFKSVCVFVYSTSISNNDQNEFSYLQSLNIVQFHMALILNLNLVALCSSFLHRDSLCWKKLPKFNLIWLLLVFTPLSLQIIHFIRMIYLSSSNCLWNSISLFSVQSVSITFVFPCLSYFISELIKIHEIRINKRYQKKVRLEFGTKLGMNSPF